MTVSQIVTWTFLISLFHSIIVAKSAYTFSNQTHRIRQKRGLIFEGGGVNKMVFGAIYPIDLKGIDQVKWRQVNCLYNIQAQYSVPTSPLYIWDKWEGRTLKDVRERFARAGSLYRDESRKFLYVLLEAFITNQGKNGRQCLLRVICENAQIAEVHGLLGEIFHEILTPNGVDISEDYKNAYTRGKKGADCLSIYWECQKGDVFLDNVFVDISN